MGLLYFFLFFPSIGGIMAEDKTYSESHSNYQKGEPACQTAIPRCGKIHPAKHVKISYEEFL